MAFSHEHSTQNRYLGDCVTNADLRVRATTSQCRNLPRAHLFVAQKFEHLCGIFIIKPFPLLFIDVLPIR